MGGHSLIRTTSGAGRQAGKHPLHHRGPRTVDVRDKLVLAVPVLVDEAVLVDVAVELNVAFGVPEEGGVPVDVLDCDVLGVLVLVDDGLGVLVLVDVGVGVLVFVDVGVGVLVLVDDLHESDGGGGATRRVAKRKTSGTISSNSAFSLALNTTHVCLVCGKARWGRLAAQGRTQAL